MLRRERCRRRRCRSGERCWDDGGGEGDVGEKGGDDGGM